MNEILTYQQMLDEAPRRVMWGGQEWMVALHDGSPYLADCMGSRALEVACGAGQVTRVADPRIEVAAEALYENGIVAFRWNQLADFQREDYRDDVRRIIAAIDNMKEHQ